MKIQLELNDEQDRVLKKHPEFNLREWLQNALGRKVREIEFKEKKVNAIIAAAGYDTRISRIESDIPKAMLKIKGKALLERQIDLLRSVNINDITVVRGYKKEKIAIPDVNYVDNDSFETTGILFSFFLAAEKLIGKTILLYADILFERDIVEKLLHEPADVALVVDRSWREHYRDRKEHTVSEAELVEVREGAISRIGCDIPAGEVFGEFIGLASFSERGAAKARSLYQNLKKEPEQEFYGSPSFAGATLSDFFNALIEQGEKVIPVTIHGGWFEIDTFEDYRKSWTRVT